MSAIMCVLIQAAFGAKACTIVDDIIEFRGVSWRYDTLQYHPLSFTLSLSHSLLVQYWW